MVRDKDDSPVSNLKREDFEIYDRGRLQAISSFAVELPDAGGAKPVPPSGSSPISKFKLPQRFVALVFDDTHLSLQDSQRLRTATQPLVRGVAASDRLGIYSTSGQITQEFTSDTNAIQRAISSLVPRPVIVTNERECPNVPYSMASRIENDQDQEALNNVIHETLICAFGGDPRKMRFAQSMAQAAIHQALRVGEADSSLVCRRIQDALHRLAEMPGARVMVLVSPGFPLSEVSGGREIVEQANQANIVINTLDARGLYVTGADDISKRPAGGPETADYKANDRLEADTRQATVLADFAAETGGTFFHNSNDLSGGLKMAGLPSASYLLGFAPRSLKQDGHYHEVKVKLIGQGKYSIQARRGYYAPLPMDAQQQEQQEIADELHSGEERGDLIADLQTESSATGITRGILVLQSRIAVRSIRFRKDQDKSSDILRMVTGIFDDNGNMVTGGEKILTMNLDEAAYRSLRESGLTVHLTFPIKPGRYLVRQVLRDAESGEISAINRAVEIVN